MGSVLGNSCIKSKRMSYRSTRISFCKCTSSATTYYIDTYQRSPGQFSSWQGVCDTATRDGDDDDSFMFYGKSCNQRKDPCVARARRCLNDLFVLFGPSKNSAVFLILCICVRIHRFIIVRLKKFLQGMFHPEVPEQLNFVYNEYKYTRWRRWH